MKTLFIISIVVVTAFVSLALFIVSVAFLIDVIHSIRKDGRK